MRSFTSRIASASASASGPGARRRWNARRCAVRRPTPGRRASSCTSRSAEGGSIRGSETGDAEPAEPREAREPAGDRAELLLLDLLGGAARLVDGGEDHVLEQLDVVGV